MLKAIQSFKGFLEGTSKAEHTIKSYLIDLKTFEAFLLESSGSRSKLQLEGLSAKDLEKYAQYLVLQGFRKNTQRRKLLTVRRWFRFLHLRKKGRALEFAERIPAPQKVERIPRVHPWTELERRIMEHPAVLPIEHRNRFILRVLLETGCTVSELAALRRECFSNSQIEFLGKSPRKLAVSPSLAQEAKTFIEAFGGTGLLFQSHNRFGSMGSPMSVRGVELMVKEWGNRWKFSGLTPRGIRHSAVVHWAERGLSDSEILARLGLRTDYALRIYQPLLKRAREKSSAKPNEKESSNTHEL